MKIPVQPISGAEPMMCITNVRKRIAACGGSMVFGWEFTDYEFETIQSNHVIWQSDEGKLMCVTPKFTQIFCEMVVIDWPHEIEFERDDAAVFDDCALPSRHISKIDNDHAVKACELMTVADKHMYDGNFEGCRYYTEKANNELRRARVHMKWDMPTRLKKVDILRTVI